MIILIILIFLGGYFLGSVPFGFLVGKLRGVDLRKEGSNNIGATNAVRVLGKRWGIPVFIADFLKGFLAVIIATKLGDAYAPLVATVFAIIAIAGCILGHNFPIWLGFKGGKGIATSGGIIIAFFPPPVFLIGIAIWILIFYVSRYVSLASIMAAASIPVTTSVFWYYGKVDWLVLSTAILLAILAIWRHKGNIRRLLTGTENRFERREKI